MHHVYLVRLRLCQQFGEAAAASTVCASDYCCKNECSNATRFFYSPACNPCKLVVQLMRSSIDASYPVRLPPPIAIVRRLAAATKLQLLLVSYAASSLAK